MSDKTYYWITLLGGWFGLHKFMTGKKGMGFLYLFTCGLFFIGWFVDIDAATRRMNKNSAKPTNSGNTYISSLYSEMNQQLAYNEVVRKYSSIYYSGLEEIESMWSVMYNLKAYTGEKADVFQQKCYQNISDLYNMLEAYKKVGYNETIPPHVPAYVRLAMLYEKQQKYEDAINICVEAIRAGATSDGNKGKMYGRLARLIRKSGINVDDDILALSMKTE